MQIYEVFENYLLMHKNVPVAEVGINGVGHIERIYKIFNHEHFPICCPKEDGKVPLNDETLDGINEWWGQSRAIPKDRYGGERVFGPLGVIKESTELLLLNRGQSMVDHYWVRSVNQNMKWEDITFYRRQNVDKKIGDFLVYEGVSLSGGGGLSDPAFALNGVQPKRWILSPNHKPILEKESTPIFSDQEPFNEKLGAMAANALGNDAVNYDVKIRNNRAYSYCESFIDENTEFITAKSIMATKKRQPGVSFYEHYLDCCKGLGIPEKMAATAFAKNIVTDSVIANEDRHHGNFGFRRCADTLKVLDSPVFDFGNSFWADKDFDMKTKTFLETDDSGTQYPAVPNMRPHLFFETEEDQFAAIADVAKGKGFTDMSKLDGFEAIVEKELMQNPKLEEKEKKARVDATVAGIRERKKITEKLLQ